MSRHARRLLAIIYATVGHDHWRKWIRLKPWLGTSPAARSRQHRAVCTLERHGLIARRGEGSYLTGCRLTRSALVVLGLPVPPMTRAETEAAIWKIPPDAIEACARLVHRVDLQPVRRIVRTLKKRESGK